MNIAHLLPYSAKFPLKTHHGRYEWALRLARRQAEQGHSVTIYASPDSFDEIMAINWQSHRGTFTKSYTNNIANILAAFQGGHHDIYHSHFDFLPYFLADTVREPIIFTQHWFPSADVAEAAKFNRTRNTLAVPVTKFMATEDKKLGIPAAEVIYHGIDLNRFRFSGKPRSDRYAFVGRVAPHKGVKQAVDLAVAAGLKLDIAGKVNRRDRAYWDSILPRIDGRRIRYLGPLGQADVAQLISKSRALIFAPQSEEAFGQTIIEAQACGTPVIIQDFGAAHELVQHGKTGFVFSSRESFYESVGNLGKINPSDCRAFAEKFSFEDMVSNYWALYKKQLTS